ncbi:BON domain-containing protein [Actinoplanes sp. LDG1-06]|uniref:BON domain-containing protein n=1 Tax=Paractinoplanes ovalisporus TaxID=2810368 RepID=A0ABS2A5H0_9ACTN|nr:BON domain-containing protein [Actinoplanes ovalisporus]MBM2615087.1 BON domain-containing protein [Actinoplanes ovalisporus]
MQPLPDDEFLAAQRRRDPVTVSRETRLVLAAVLGLAGDDRTRHEPIRVSAQNDVVLLAGAVRSWSARTTAAEVVRSLPGAQDVCNTLVVPPGAAAPRGDGFDEIVAGLRPSTRERWRNRRSRAGSTLAARRTGAGPVVFAALIVLWLALPVVTVVFDLPALPALLIALAGTAATVSVRRR